MKLIERSYEIVLPVTVEALWNFHASAAALQVLTPASRQLTPVSTDLEVRNGALHIMRFRQFGLTMEWYARISEVNPPTGFVDTAEKSPFAAWRHQHSFLEHPEGALLRDTIRYLPPGGPFAGIIDRLFVRKDLDGLFAFRHEATRRYLCEPAG